MISANIFLNPFIHMGRYYFNKKEEADNCKKINTSTLKEWGYLDQSFLSGKITWTHNFSGQKSSIGIETILSPEKKAMRLFYTQTNRQTGEKKDFDYAVPLTTTQCYFGGVRYWFQCPLYKNNQYCGRRVGTLYKSGDYFACRHCHELSYASKNENRRHPLFPLGKVFDIEIKLETLYRNLKTRYYKGKLTKTYKKILELERQYNNINMDDTLEYLDHQKKL